MERGGGVVSTSLGKSYSEEREKGKQYAIL